MGRKESDDVEKAIAAPVLRWTMRACADNLVDDDGYGESGAMSHCANAAKE